MKPSDLPYLVLALLAIAGGLFAYGISTVKKRKVVIRFLDED